MAQNRPDEPLDLDKILEETFKNTAFAPQKTAVAPQKTATATQTAATPQKTAAAPQKTSVTTQKTAVAPQKTAAAPQKTAAAPQKTAVAPQKTATAPQRTQTMNDSIFGPVAVKSGNSQSAAGDTIKAGNKSYTVKKLLGSGAEGDIYMSSQTLRDSTP